MPQKILVSLISLLPALAFSQVQDSTFISAAKAHAITVYEDEMKAQSRLNNGTKYLVPEHSFEEHPWFASEDWISGSVSYDDTHFRDVPLMYDLVRGTIITEHYPSGQPIELVPEKVSGFTVSGHTFKRIDNAMVQNSLPQSGFYDILYDGPTKLIARRQKFRKEKIESTEVEIYYEARNRYFVLKNGVYFPVKTKSSLLKLLGDRKQEINKFVRQKKLPFASHREQLLSAMAEYYDSLR